ncbi:MAG: folate-binding protein YgfZ [Uliginosibacterium sp.]|jgi:folate-binding protein YgfZ|nr:folate-binding protein YgfZ [Uliginosibacterium sp.]
MHPKWLDFLNVQCPTARIERGNQVCFSRSGAGLCPLTHLGVIRVDGEEAASFLHNITSNDIKKLPVGGVQWNSLNSAKGRMLASFLVWRDEAGFGLILAEDLGAEISKKLSMYVLRAKVKVRDASGEIALLGLTDGGARLAALPGFPPVQSAAASAANGLTVVGLPQGQRVVLAVPRDALDEVWAVLAAEFAPADTARWLYEDIAEGIPLITKATQDEFVAQMVNFELLGGVSFQKGCYPGQEIVARTQYLGKLKKRMYRAQLVAEVEPAIGQDLYAPAFGEQSSGKVVSVSPAPEGGYAVLVVLQMAAHEEGVVHLGSVTGPQLCFAPLPYPVD